MERQVEKVSKAAMQFAGLNDALLRLLRDWRPLPRKRELEYRNALFEYLREALPEECRIEKEYRHSGTTSDLYLRWKGALGVTTGVFFELKRNLKRKGEFNRFVGQIEEINPRRNIVIVVLIGELDASLVARLKEQYDEFLRLYIHRRTPQMAIIEVP